MAIRRCPSCGAAVDADDTVLATTCAFCDSPLVDGTEEASPVDLVVPFVIPKERAVGLLKGFLQEHWFAPETLRKAAAADALDAVLVPFYAFDALARTDWSAQVGVNWYRTETYTTWEDGKAVTKTRQVKETEWFPLSGSHAREWDGQLVSASKGLPEAESNELEPYDLGRAKPYTAALTAGLLAEHPTIERTEAQDVARNELSSLEGRVIQSQLLPGDRSKDLRTHTDIDVNRVQLVLMPVWIAAMRGPAGPVRLLVNGQTGEVVGKVPRSKTKVGCLIGVGLGLVLLIILIIAGFSSIVACLGSFQ